MHHEKLYVVKGKNRQYKNGGLKWLSDDGVERFRNWGYQVTSTEGLSTRELRAIRSNIAHSSIRRSEYEEVNSNRDRLRDSSIPKINQDDLIDVMLAVEKGI